MGWTVATAAIAWCIGQVLHAGTRGAVHPVHPWLVAGSVAVLTAGLAWGVFAWRAVLVLLDPAGYAPAFGALLRVAAPSSVARYVPGGVWQFVATGALAPGAAVPRGRLVGGLVVQTVFSLVAAGLVATALVPRIGDLSIPPLAWRAALGAAIVATIALVHPAPLRRLLGLASRVPGAGVLAWRGTWSDGLRLVAIHVVAWLTYGAAFWLFVHGMIDAPTATLGRLTGASVLAFLAGYMVIVAPAGLGPRELALSVLLAPAVGPAAPAIALLARAWSVAADVALVAVAAATLWPRRRQS